MCDTLGFVSGSKAIFGKNSDRSPNEPQILEYIPAALHNESELKVTYISVPQVKETHAKLTFPMAKARVECQSKCIRTEQKRKEKSIYLEKIAESAFL